MSTIIAKLSEEFERKSKIKNSNYDKNIDNFFIPEISGRSEFHIFIY